MLLLEGNTCLVPSMGQIFRMAGSRSTTLDVARDGDKKLDLCLFFKNILLLLLDCNFATVN